MAPGPETLVKPGDFPTEAASVQDWLAKLGLSCYWENFQQASLTEPQQLFHLDPQTLETLNIKIPGHKRKLENALKALQINKVGVAKVSATVHNKYN